MRHLHLIMTGSDYFIPRTYFFSYKDLFFCMKFWAFSHVCFIDKFLPINPNMILTGESFPFFQVSVIYKFERKHYFTKLKI